MRTPHRLVAANALGIALVFTACVSSTQSVRIDCVPEDVQVFVDGRLLEESGGDVFLRTDEPHKVYVKGPGYEPVLVVLEPEPDERGRAHFPERELCLRPVAVGMQRQLDLEAETQD